MIQRCTCFRFPPNYARRWRFASQTSEKIAKPDIMEQPKVPDFRICLDSVEIAEIIFPLSKDVTTMLVPFSDFSNGNKSTE